MEEIFKDLIEFIKTNWSNWYVGLVAITLYFFRKFIGELASECGKRIFMLFGNKKLSKELHNEILRVGENHKIESIDFVDYHKQEMIKPLDFSLADDRRGLKRMLNNRDIETPEIGSISEWYFFCKELSDCNTIKEAKKIGVKYSNKKRKGDKQ